MGNVYCWNIKKLKFHGASATFPKTYGSVRMRKEWTNLIQEDDENPDYVAVLLLAVL